MRGARPWILALCLALPSPAQARFHLWNVNEVFSNADGSVQFVEFVTTSGFQDLLADHEAQFLQNGAVIANAPFLTDLFTTDTATHSLLMATPAFQAAAGIEPDYTMPAQTIPVATCDGVRMSGAALTLLSFAAGSIPLDGTHSLNRDIGVATATPTNFAGETGTLVPEPAAAALGVGALGALGLSRARASRRR